VTGGGGLAATWVAGVDGCRIGWVAARRNIGSGEIRVETILDLEALLSDDDLAVITIDCPIGLLDGAVPGGRECDRQTRALLGVPR